MDCCLNDHESGIGAAFRLRLFFHRLGSWLVVIGFGSALSARFDVRGRLALGPSRTRIDHKANDLCAVRTGGGSLAYRGHALIFAPAEIDR